MALAVGIAAGLFLYFFGPHAFARSKFAEYRQAFLAGDAEAVAKMTADAELLFWQAQFAHALKSQASTVEALNFRSRSGVLKIRRDVLNGRLKLDDLQKYGPPQLYAASLDQEGMSKTFGQASVLFAVPTGSGSVRAYLSLGQISDDFETLALMTIASFANGLYVELVAYGDGSHKIDPTPLFESASLQMETLARRVEPTGNQFLVKSLIRPEDSGREEELWSPLIKE